MAQHGIDLDDEAKGKLKTAIEYSVEKMDEKVNSHLMETVSEVGSAFLAKCHRHCTNFFR